MVGGIGVMSEGVGGVVGGGGVCFVKGVGVLIAERVHHTSPILLTHFSWDGINI